MAARRGYTEALQKLWEYAKENLTTEEINNKLLLDTDNAGWNAWHMTARWVYTETLQKLWEYAKENLTTDEVNNKLLLPKTMREGPPGTWQQIGAI
jgi:chromatin remodeling complex protein RSC6